MTAVSAFLLGLALGMAIALAFALYVAARAFQRQAEDFERQKASRLAP